MKIFLVFLFSVSVLQSQGQTDEKMLETRLGTYLQLTREKKFSELMDYIHPVLFTVAPKESLIQAFNEGFDNESLTISIDSVYIKNISPVFSHEDISYRKVDYFMIMSFDLKDKSAFSEASAISEMTANFQKTFPNDKVTFDQRTSTFTIAGDDILIAIKDNEKAEWLFLGYEEEQSEIMEKLLPEPVIIKFLLK